jgi:hypothetical protein
VAVGVGIDEDGLKGIDKRISETNIPAAVSHNGFAWGQILPVLPLSTFERFVVGVWGGANLKFPTGGAA